MANVLVLGGGWVATAVVSHASGRVPWTQLDPPLDDALAARDARATSQLREHIARHGTTAVVNACGRTVGTDAELEHANVGFVSWLCDALAGTGVRLVHIGSASEYGDPGTEQPVAEGAPCRPSSPYAASKLAGTSIAIQARSSGLDVTVARVFNIVGRPVPPQSPLSRWIDELRSLGADGGEIEVWWPPTVRDFVSLDDVARALVELCDASETPELVNVCSGVGVSFGDAVSALAEQLGVRATVVSAQRPGIEAVVGDPSLLRASIGWVPSMSPGRLARCALGGGEASDAR